MRCVKLYCSFTLVESIQSAPDRTEANAALEFASGYIRALDDFTLITPDESREARAAILNARSAVKYDALRGDNTTLLVVDEFHDPAFDSQLAEMRNGLTGSR